MKILCNFHWTVTNLFHMVDVIISNKKNRATSIISSKVKFSVTLYLIRSEIKEDILLNIDVGWIHSKFCPMTSKWKVGHNCLHVVIEPTLGFIREDTYQRETLQHT